MTVDEMVEYLNQQNGSALVSLLAADMESYKMYESIHVESDSKGGVVICGDITSAEIQT